jgi:hypothetical protein
MSDDEKTGRSQARSDTAGDSATHADDSDAHLSEAARGVIRQSADPRLDAHMARLLSETPSTPTRSREQDREVERLNGELDGVRGQLESVRGQLETALGELRTARGEVGSARADRDAAARNAKTLMWLLAAAVVAIVILLVLIVVR